MTFIPVKIEIPSRSKFKPEPSGIFKEVLPLDQMYKFKF